MKYTENDLYDGMTLYWGQRIEPKEIYTWNKERKSVTASFEGASECVSYDVQKILMELNRGYCHLTPLEVIYLISN